MKDNNQKINEIKKSIEFVKLNKIKEASIILSSLLNDEDLKTEAHLYLGICKIKENKVNEAITLLEKSITFSPRHEFANLNLGLVHFNNKNYEISILYLNKTIEINENNQLAIYHLGLINLILENYNKAINQFNKLLKINRKDQNAILNLGIIYNKLGEYEKSIETYKNLIEINPKNIHGINNLGLTYFNLSKFNEAKECFKKCVDINNNFIPAYSNLGRVQTELKEFDNALENFNLVIKNNNKDYNSLFAIGKIYLSIGKYSEGFKFYEYRKFINRRESIDYIKKNFNSKEWNGENLENKKILIISEQGFGDTIQFSRYLEMINSNNEIIFLINRRLNFLFKNKNYKLINDLKSIKEHDYYQNLLSLPKIYFDKNESFIKNVNFIKSEKEIDNKWRTKLKDDNKFKVGIFWQGNKNYYGDNRRSIPLKEFEKIIYNKNISVVSLQKGDGLDQIKLNGYGNNIKDFSNIVDNDDDAYKDTISILKNLDLLITSDSSLVHLAGTMQINTWLLLCYNPDWRWYIDINKSTFYETVKIFQQNTPGNWKDVFKKIDHELQNLFKN